MTETAPVFVLAGNPAQPPYPLYTSQRLSVSPTIHRNRLGTEATGFQVLRWHCHNAHAVEVVPVFPGCQLCSPSHLSRLGKLRDISVSAHRRHQA